MARPETHKGMTRANAGEALVAIPVAGTALLLIDVINDLAFDGSGSLVARAESMAAPDHALFEFARLRNR